MMKTYCVPVGTAHERLGAYIDQALAGFAMVASDLALPTRYRVKVEVVLPIKGSGLPRDLDLSQRCWAHTQIHAETISGTRPRKEHAPS